MPNAQKTDTPDPKPPTKRELVLQIPIAGEAQRHFHKQGIRYDAERMGLSRTDGNEAELNEMRREIPRNWLPEINEALASLRHANYRAVEKEKYETGKPVPELESELRKAIESSDAIDAAFASAAETEILLDLALETIANGGQIDLASVLRGGRDLIMPNRTEQVSVLGRAISPPVPDAKGRAQANVEIPVFASASIPVVNYGPIIRYSKTVRDEIKAGLLAEANELIGDGPRIPISQRDELKTEAAQKILTARRQLEAAIIDAEFEGKRVHRPSDTPWHVLLWVEPDPTKPALQVVADNTGRRMVNPDGTTTGEAHTVKPTPGSAAPSAKKKMVNPGDEPTEDWEN